MLAINEINPTQELLNLIPMMDLEQKIRTLCFLVTYSQSKPTESSEPVNQNNISELLKEVSDEELIKSLGYKDIK